MSDIKLFRTSGDGVSEIRGSAITLEKSLQTLIEKNMESLLGVRFLASEYSTSKGRMDSLGIDENGSPVIIEYKRASNENVINQGLSYLNWLMDHRADFELLVMKRLNGKEQVEEIDWSAPRLICIAGGFTRYDLDAVKEINRNIELVRYRRFGGELLLFELLTATTEHPAAKPASVAGNNGSSGDKAGAKYKTVEQYLDDADPELRDLFESIKSYLLGFGDDVQMKMLKTYIAFRRLKNFACVRIFPRDGQIMIYANVNPDEVNLEDDFTRDMRGIGHNGTGDLAIVIVDEATFEKAKPLFERSYDNA